MEDTERLDIRRKGHIPNPIENEDEIAEAIFDWWVSDKGYEEWFADKYLQYRLDFEEDKE